MSLSAQHRQREAFDEAIAELFDEVDVDGNGAITGDDVPLLLSKLGIKPVATAALARAVC